MRAAVVEGPGQIVVKEIGEPVMGEYDALVEMLASAVCSGTDHHIVHNDPYQKPAYPLILGHESIGRVIKTGSKVRYLKDGDMVTRVFNKLPEGSGLSLQWGAFAERGIVSDWQAMREDNVEEKTWRRYMVHRVLPDGFDPIASTMIITWRETYSFINRMMLKNGDVMLVIGSGANALAFADHGRNLGIETIVIGSPSREESFTKSGVRFFVSYHDTNYVHAIKDAGYISVHTIIDAIGHEEMTNAVLPLLQHEGKLGIYGLDAFPNFKLESSKAQGDFSYYSGEIYEEALAHADIIAYIQNGKLDAWNYLSHEHIYDLDHIEDALKASWERKVIKSVVKFF